MRYLDVTGAVDHYAKIKNQTRLEVVYLNYIFGTFEDLVNKVLQHD